MLSKGSRSRYWVFGAIIFILIVLAIGFFVFSSPPERKPIELEKPYAFYIIIDENSGKTLTYVTTVVVSVGDEYLNGNGQWYKIVRVEENRAYAQPFDKKQ
ncbi:MAG TPA: stage II sporulation protein P [Selenomonadales bacterium]|nr:stage II sporulation protein P [Selenomonadales bacterium]